MSLCIAAITKRYSPNPKIVLCFDKKISTDVSSAETEFKFDFITGQKLCVLLAGTVTAARELIAVYGSSLRDKKVGELELLEALREPPRIKKRRMAEAYIQSSLAISYNEFLKTGKQQLPDDIFHGVVRHIQEMTLGVELIIAGFATASPGMAPAPVLFRFAWEEVERHHNFATIGSGAPAADQCLFRRRQSQINTQLAETMYNVYEAKRFGEQSPTVGAETIMAIVEPGPLDGVVQTTTVKPNGFSILEKLYAQYGPRPIQDIPEFGEDSFNPPVP
jgi:20S proteasome alpha/beta subunit